MRRAAVAVVVGCAFGGICTGVGHQHDVSDVRLTAAIQSVTKKAAVKTVKPAAPAVKSVTYSGYAVSVPAAWPVYNLSKDPGQCVRYDVNAVYLGTPGPDQNCPPHLVGRADTVSIGGPAVPGVPPVPVQAALRPAVGAKLVQGPDLTATPGTIVANAQLQELAVTMPDGAPAITATYGASPALVTHLLSGLHLVRAQSALAPAARQHPNAIPAPGPRDGGQGPRPGGVIASAGPQASASPAWTPPSWPGPVPTGVPAPTPTPTGRTTPSPAPSPSPTTPPPSSPPAGALAGFDTCTAPSLQAMKAWRANYAAAAIYIGGQEMGCDYGNLSKSWVQAAEGMGWSLMPIFVGLQAPCNSFTDEINPSQAATQGQQAAIAAAADAASFGLGPGSPVYFDMEAYNETKASCVTAVLTFLDAWDRQLQASGYVSGVYSSAGSGVVNLQDTTSIGGHALAEPQAIWFALWDNAVNLTGSPYMSAAVWSPSARSKQYAGPRVVTVGGISLDIDSDLVNSAVAHG
jgi:hypothetical protein